MLMTRQVETVLEKVLETVQTVLENSLRVKVVHVWAHKRGWQLRPHSSPRESPVLAEMNQQRLSQAADQQPASSHRVCSSSPNTRKQSDPLIPAPLTGKDSKEREQCDDRDLQEDKIVNYLQVNLGTFSPTVKEG